MLLLGILFVVLITVMTGVFYNKSVNQTRTDAIADSVAVYSQAYDFSYNKGQAEAMTKELSKWNNENSKFYEYEAEISFPDENILTVNGTLKSPMLFHEMAGQEYLTTEFNASVQSKDVNDDVLIIPKIQ